MDEKILNELKDMKKLMVYQLLALGVTPKGVSKLTGVSEKRIRNQFPMNQIFGMMNLDARKPLECGGGNKIIVSSPHD